MLWNLCMFLFSNLFHTSLDGYLGEYLIRKCVFIAAVAAAVVVFYLKQHVVIFGAKLKKYGWITRCLLRMLRLLNDVDIGNGLRFIWNIFHSKIILEFVGNISISTSTATFLHVSILRNRLTKYNLPKSSDTRQSLNRLAEKCIQMNTVRKKTRATRARARERERARATIHSCVRWARSTVLRSLCRDDVWWFIRCKSMSEKRLNRMRKWPFWLRDHKKKHTTHSFDSFIDRNDSIQFLMSLNFSVELSDDQRTLHLFHDQHNVSVCVQ